MPDAVIVAAARTPIGTARKGTLLDVSAFDLAKYTVAETLKRSGIPSNDVDDLALGESLQGGGDIARYAAVDLGLTEIPGVALNRHCASGMASVQGAAASIMAGMDTVVIAGGAESLSTSPTTMKRKMGTDDYEQWMSPSHPATPDAPAFDMSITVGYNTAKAAGLTRADCDAWAFRSHERAIAAIDEGRLEEEIVAIEVTMRDGTTKIFDTDEHPRRGGTMEKMASLKPLHPEIEDFPITAGNSSGLNDGGRGDDDRQQRLRQGARPHAARQDRVVGVLGCAAPRHRPRPDLRDPEGARTCRSRRSTTSTSPRSTRRSRRCPSPRAASSVSPRTSPTRTDRGCSLGHPVAATGARMIITTMYELRRRGGGMGLASMCAGGGMGSATVFEVYPG